MRKWVRVIGIRLEPVLPRATLMSISNSSFAYLYESIDGLTRLSIWAPQPLRDRGDCCVSIALLLGTSDT